MTNEVSGLGSPATSQFQAIKQLQSSQNDSGTASESKVSKSSESTVSISPEAQALLQAEQSDVMTLNSSGDRGTRPK